MAITDRTRKVLWGRSGTRCAICRLEVVLDATASDDESVVGEECHIVSGQTAGPRHEPAFPKEDVDSYENLILLCRVHHKLIDDQPETYTSEVLKQIKANHEKWVKDKLNDNVELKPVRLRRVKENTLPLLIRLTAGKDILNLVDGACSFSFDHDDLASEQEVELVGAFIQEARDWGEIGPDLEPAQKIRTGFELTESIEQLEQAGFYVFGGREVHRLEGGAGAPSPWSIAILRVLRKTNPSIVVVGPDDLRAETAQHSAAKE